MMPRTSQVAEKRRELVPIVARTFAALGYRRTTTAELAQRCGVRENVLYRLWPDKKGMFIAAIGYVYELSEVTWRRLLAGPDGEETAADRLLAYESEHYGEFGHYRIVFAGLSETDDPEIRAALADMYKRYHRFVRQQIAVHRARRSTDGGDADLRAWAVLGLGTVNSIARELGLVSESRRRRLFRDMGQALLEG
jgi:AcrR family transcriptional regulator